MSPKTSIQFKKIREKSKENIMTAATMLFAKQGYHGTSISQIAETAKVSKGLMYNYFKSKEELLDAILLKGFGEVDAPMEAMMKQRDPYKKLRMFVEGCFALVNNKQQRVHWQFMLSVMTQHEVVKRIQKFYSGYLDKYMGMFELLFTEMGVPDPKLESYRLGAMIDGVMLHYLNLFPKGYPIIEMKNEILEQYEKYRKKK